MTKEEAKKIILGTGSYEDVKCGNTVSVTGDGGNAWNYFGPAYKKTCENWKKAKLNECVSEVKIDFNQLRERLNADFEKTIKEAEKNGIFNEDDKLGGHITSINLKELFPLCK